MKTLIVKTASGNENRLEVSKYSMNKDGCLTMAVSGHMPALNFDTYVEEISEVKYRRNINE